MLVEGDGLCWIFLDKAASFFKEVQLSGSGSGPKVTRLKSLRVRYAILNADAIVIFVAVYLIAISFSFIYVFQALAVFGFLLMVACVISYSVILLPDSCFWLVVFASLKLRPSISLINSLTPPCSLSWRKLERLNSSRKATISS